MPLIRVAVVSDLHVYEEPLALGVQPPSRLHTSLSRQDVDHPISALVELIQHEALEADLLVACGDLGNQASGAGIIYAWSEIQRIRDALGVDDVIGTAGNHDLDSRHHGASVD